MYTCVIHNALILSATCTYGDVKLSVGESESEPYELINNELARGHVEICIDGVYGTICDEGWDHTNASVVCKQLGFSRYGI